MTPGDAQRVCYPEMMEELKRYQRKNKLDACGREKT